MDYTCSAVKNGDTARIELTGRIGEQAAEELKAAFRSLDGSVKEVVLDFAGVSHIGSAGIGKLLLMYKALAESGTKVRIERIPARIFELFRDLKLDSLFELAQL